MSTTAHCSNLPLIIFTYPEHPNIDIIHSNDPWDGKEKGEKLRREVMEERERDRPSQPGDMQERVGGSEHTFTTKA